MGALPTDPAVPQNADGTPHFTYYDYFTSLSFVWDGKADHIEVCHGGYGEAAIDGISITDLSVEDTDSPESWLDWFRKVCDAYVEVYIQGQVKRIAELKSHKCPLCGKTVPEGAHTCKGWPT